MASGSYRCSYHYFITRSLSGLLVPLFTGRIVDKFSVSHINWNLIALFGGIFVINALLSGLGLYLLSKIGEKLFMRYAQFYREHIIQLKCHSLTKMKVVN